jgi:hypothetical protein
VWRGPQRRLVTIVQLLTETPYIRHRHLLLRGQREVSFPVPSATTGLKLLCDRNDCAKLLVAGNIALAANQLDIEML